MYRSPNRLVYISRNEDFIFLVIKDLRDIEIEHIQGSGKLNLRLNLNANHLFMVKHRISDNAINIGVIIPK
ncbi:hypothetical protein EDD38_1156 [Kitasatospora cineracea]|uniref:Uncharacterized protein n=1 Tax=Kitasatospora cineracea TaxID=88074 RepID=A0A3N4RWT1_9ACTN|nr:hypothetical protein EDD38_1156 [Kitasatospora cineracea]